AHLPGLKRLLLLSFTYGVTFAVYPAVWSYFTQARFGWDSTMTGVSLATFGFSMALTQGVILRPVVRRLGERRTVLLGLSFSAIGFLGIITIPIGWLVLALTPVMAFGGVTGPSVQGLMSRAAADDQQGELQGLLTSISALTLIISPMMMTQTFAFFTSPAAPTYLPTAPFILSLGLTFISLMIFLGGRRTA
ncbi:MAG: TCR/Tet family MFS transporter, partial [Rhodobacteraceae bacterium]|nr:TCR/Tet family MFS transporter [Paracoccaceae bacterium]